MSDLDRFISLYKDLGINLKTINEADGRKFLHLQVGDNMSKKFSGYENVYSEIAFDQNGKFISQGLWIEMKD